MYQTTNHEMEDVKYIKQEIEKRFPETWAKLFEILPDEMQLPNGIRCKRDNREAIKQLKKQVQQWEKENRIDQTAFKEIFDIELFEDKNPDRYSPTEFKWNVFAKDLWTVKAALRTPDPELDQYKESFKDADPLEIYATVYNILIAAKDYAAKNIPFARRSTVESLELDFLHEDQYMLRGVIGRGIRSEILYRLYPGTFAIMTRRNLWGMYFLTDADEFLVDQFDDETLRYRTSTEWEYDYPRFCFYSNFLANLIDAAYKQVAISMDQSMRFGYVNFFLNALADANKNQIKKLMTPRVVATR